MRLAVISDTHIGPWSANFDNSKSKDILKEVTSNESLDAELLIHLGDLIQEESREADLKNFTSLSGFCSSSRQRFAFIPGNHDLVNLSKEELSDIIPLPRSMDLGEGVVIFLYGELTGDPPSSPAIIERSELERLERELSSCKTEAVICTHYSLADVDLDDNYWFRGKEDKALIQNRREVRSILEASGKVKAVLNGHLHAHYLTVHRDIPYFTLQAAVEVKNVEQRGRTARAWGLFNLTPEAAVLTVFGEDPKQLTYSYS